MLPAGTSGAEGLGAHKEPRGAERPRRPPPHAAPRDRALSHPGAPRPEHGRGARCPPDGGGRARGRGGAGARRGLRGAPPASRRGRSRPCAQRGPRRAGHLNARRGAASRPPARTRGPAPRAGGRRPGGAGSAGELRPPAAPGERGAPRGAGSHAGRGAGRRGGAGGTGRKRSVAGGREGSGRPRARPRGGGVKRGTPRSSLPLAQIIDQACQEAEAYKDAGVDGLIVENMHDRPYTLCPGPEVTAAMTAVGAAVRRLCPHLALGVQVLCAANQQAAAVALAAGLDFIRVEGFVFSHVADEGIINACAGNLLRYRKLIGAENIQIFADIKKKHSAHALTADISVAETASAAELFLADGVVLTGTATGLPADPGELREVQHAVKIPVLIGSGVTLENVKNYLDANALIIGSYFKREGYWANGVDPDRVKKFMERISKLRE